MIIYRKNIIVIFLLIVSLLLVGACQEDIAQEITIPTNINYSSSIQIKTFSNIGAFRSGSDNILEQANTFCIGKKVIDIKMTYWSGGIVKDIIIFYYL